MARTISEGVRTSFTAFSPRFGLNTPAKPWPGPRPGGGQLVPLGVPGEKELEEQEIGDGEQEATPEESPDQASEVGAGKEAGIFRRGAVASDGSVEQTVKVVAQNLGLVDRCFV